MTDDEKRDVIRELERLKWTYDSTTETFSNDEETIGWEEALARVPTLRPAKL